MIILWALNTARGWTNGVSVIIPFTILVNAAALLVLNIATVRGAICLGIVSQVPNLVVSAYLSARGIQSIKSAEKSESVII